MLMASSESKANVTYADSQSNAKPRKRHNALSVNSVKLYIMIYARLTVFQSSMS